METVPVTTANTVCLKKKKVYKLIVILSGNGKSMSYPLKNEIKIRAMVKTRQANQ